LNTSTRAASTKKGVMTQKECKNKGCLWNSTNSTCYCSGAAQTAEATQITPDPLACPTGRDCNIGYEAWPSVPAGTSEIPYNSKECEGIRSNGIKGFIHCCQEGEKRYRYDHNEPGLCTPVYHKIFKIADSFGYCLKDFHINCVQAGSGVRKYLDTNPNNGAKLPGNEILSHLESAPTCTDKDTGIDQFCCVTEPRTDSEGTYYEKRPHVYGTNGIFGVCEETVIRTK
jgi:hypothetical protein